MLDPVVVGVSLKVSVPLSEKVLNTMNMMSAPTQMSRSSAEAIYHTYFKTGFCSGACGRGMKVVVSGGGISSGWLLYSIERVF